MAKNDLMIAGIGNTPTYWPTVAGGGAGKL